MYETNCTPAYKAVPFVFYAPTCPPTCSPHLFFTKLHPLTSHTTTRPFSVRSRSKPQMRCWNAFTTRQAMSFSYKSEGSCGVSGSLMGDRGGTSRHHKCTSTRFVALRELLTD